MGERGPVPKRDEERAGHRAKDYDADHVQVAGPVVMPMPSEEWHADATAWYLSLAESGQSRFFEPSDWQAARIVAHQLTMLLSGKPNAQLFKAVDAAMDKLGTTEGARRRLRIEVERSASPEDRETEQAREQVGDRLRVLRGGG